MALAAAKEAVLQSITSLGVFTIGKVADRYAGIKRLRDRK
jgi:hypothetical protein